MADLKARYFLYQIRPQFGTTAAKNMAFNKMFETELRSMGLVADKSGSRAGRRQTPGERTRAFLDWARSAKQGD